MSDELTIQEVARLLGCSVKTIRNYLRKGKLYASKVPGKRGDEYRFSQNEISKIFQIRKTGKSSTVKNDGISFKELYQRVEEEKKDLQCKLEQALIRLGQLESQRLMLSERAESFQQKEKEYQVQIEELKNQLGKQQEIIDQLTRRKWWQFWLPKKPFTFQTNSP